VRDSSGRLLVLLPSACKHATLLSGVPRFVERPRQIALAKKGERSVGSVGARAPPKYKVCPLPTVRKPRYLHRTAHEIFETSILRLFIGFRILAGRARLKASLFPHRHWTRWISATSTSMPSIRQLETKLWNDYPILSFQTSIGIHLIQSTFPILDGSQPSGSRRTGNRQTPLHVHQTSFRARCE